MKAKVMHVVLLGPKKAGKVKRSKMGREGKLKAHSDGNAQKAGPAKSRAQHIHRF